MGFAWNKKPAEEPKPKPMEYAWNKKPGAEEPKPEPTDGRPAYKLALLFGDEWQRFEEQVNQLIKDGYMPTGGVCMVPKMGTYQIAQAMVLKEKA
jgi:hypothetical protein